MRFTRGIDDEVIRPRLFFNINDPTLPAWLLKWCPHSDAHNILNWSLVLCMLFKDIKIEEDKAPERANVSRTKTMCSARYAHININTMFCVLLSLKSDSFIFEKK